MPDDMIVMQLIPDEPEKAPGAPEREPDMVDDSRPPGIIDCIYGLLMKSI